MMRTLEEENRDLRENNSELAQKVQYWKMLAGQRDTEKLDLMKEINELRLKLSRLRSGGAAHSRKLEIALQSASEEALSHLVQASNAVARTIEMAKTHMRDRQELELSSPPWSKTSGTPTTDKVLKVPPTLMGGKHIQPVVSLNRYNNITSRPLPQPRSPNRQHTTMALPMHMLQDIIIPLTRIDMDTDIPNNNSDSDENSSEGMGLDNSMDEAVEDSQHNLTDDEGFETSRRLDAVAEDLEPEDLETPTRRPSADPLEGPSWLLDAPSRPQRSRPLEPDSTTQAEDSAAPPPPAAGLSNRVEDVSSPAPLFSPTRRRRKRPSSPAPAASPALSTPHASRAPRNSRSPRPANRNTSRILKVLLPKMQLEGETAGVSGAAVGAPEAEIGVSPPKRAMRFDAPSPNGATVTGVIISETPMNRSSLEVSDVAQESSRRRDNYDSSASSSDSVISQRDSNTSGRGSNASEVNGSSLSLALSTRLMVNERDCSPGEQDNNTNNRFSKDGVHARRPNKRDGHLNDGDSRDGHTSGRDSRTNGRDSHASARDSHASGRDSHASARDSHATARDNHASARDSHASGRDSHASARDSHANARNNHASARDSHANARNNHASARDSHASARDSLASARDSQARGRDSRAGARAGRAASHDSHDDSGSGDDSGGGRLRRTRKPVTYKEKPLNRKLRR